MIAQEPTITLPAQVGLPRPLQLALVKPDSSSLLLYAYQLAETEKL